MVVDIQERLVVAFEEDTQTRLIHNAGLLVSGAKTLAVPVLATEQYPAGLGHTVAPLAEALGGEVERHAKVAFSCLGCEPFTEALAATGRKDVVLCGAEAHVCVYQTALDLLDAGHRVVVAADAVASRSAANWQWALQELRAQGCSVVPTETVLFSWLGAAGTPEFKAISKRVK